MASYTITVFIAEDTLAGRADVVTLVGLPVAASCTIGKIEIHPHGEEFTIGFLTTTLGNKVTNLS
jgi:hypothetical protein